MDMVCDVNLLFAYKQVTSPLLNLTTNPYPAIEQSDSPGRIGPYERHELR